MHPSFFPHLYLALLLALASPQIYAGTEPTASHQGEATPLDRESLKLIEKLQHDIKSASEIKSRACDPKADKTCSFSMVCDKFRGGRNSPELYKNKAGEVIPNFKLIDLQDSLERCKNTVTSRSIKKVDPNYEIKMKRKAKQKAFYDLVAEKNEEKEEIAVERALIDSALNKKPSSSDQNQDIPSRQEIENNIRSAESAAKVQLSDAVRAKWIEMLDSSDLVVMPKMDATDVENPFLNLDLLVNTKAAGGEKKLLANRAKYSKELDRAFKIFTDTKAQMISVLNQRKNSTNAPQIENMIERIKTIKMTNPAFGPNISRDPTCLSPNAFYRQTIHEFTICPQMLQMPSPTIQMTIAHELGHAIDPCNVSYPFLKTDGKTKPARPNTNASKDRFYAQKGLTVFTPLLPNQSSEKYSSYDAEAMNKIAKQDYQSFTQIQKEGGLGSKSNPFEKVISCLASKNSVAARVGDLELAKKTVNDKITALKKSGYEDKDPEVVDLKKTLSHMDSVFSDKTACSFMTSEKGHSQMQEAFSDWMSSEVLAKKVAEISDHQEKQDFALELNGFMAALDCQSYDADIAKTAKNILAQSGCTSQANQLDHDINNMSKYEDLHPEASDRVEKIFLSHPTLNSAFGCQPSSGVKHCE